MHTFNIGSVQSEQEHSDSNFHGLNESTQPDILFRVGNILSSTLAFPTKSLMCCIKVCNSQTSTIFKQECRSILYFSEKIT